MNCIIESLENRTHLTVSLDAIDAQSLPAGKSIFVPVTGTTDSSFPVAYTASTADSQMSVRELKDLTFLRMNISIGGVDKGYMEFALFGEIAPNTVAHITNLVNSGFYTNLNFHRVIPGFMAQGGAGGQVANIDDEFHPDAIFSTSGLLAMANANRTERLPDQSIIPINDTNNSQFFVTVDETRWLDFRHTIFGQLIRGTEVLDAIVAVPTDGSNAPTADVRITSASMVENRVDTVLLVKGGPGSLGSTATVSVTAADHNSTSAKSFSATAYADTSNSPTYLNPIADQQTVSDLPLSISAGTTDIDSTAAAVEAIALNQNQVSVAVTGNKVTVTPVNGFSGSTDVIVKVPQGNGLWDSQRVTVTVLSGPFATYDQATRTLNVNGTSGNDTLAFSVAGPNLLRVNMNGVAYDFGLSAIEKLNVQLGDGNDSMIVNASISTLVNAQGGNGNDTITGGAGNDLLYGNDGNDSLSGGDGVDTVYGNFGDDVIGGGLKRDSLLGGIGNDTLTGGDGPDTVYGGDGTDLLRGGKGADYIEGKGKADTIYGGSQNDTIYGQAGSDLIYGDDGDDAIFVSDTAPLVFRDTVYGGAGTDRVTADSNDSVFEAEVDLLA